MRFKVLMLVKMSVFVFWVVMPYRLTGASAETVSAYKSTWHCSPEDLH
jgi:hypothetical protein